MDRKKVQKWSYLLGLLLFVCFFCGVFYVFFFAEDNFCVTVEGMADRYDQGERCFRTPQEMIDYKEYLMDKYELGKDPEFNVESFNLSLNIS